MLLGFSEVIKISITVNDAINIFRSKRLKCNFYAEIPGLQGLYANAKTLEACREELRESLEEWIVLGLQLDHTLPILDGISLSFSKEVA